MTKNRLYSFYNAIHLYDRLRFYVHTSANSVKPLYEDDITFRETAFYYCIIIGAVLKSDNGLYHWVLFYYFVSEYFALLLEGSNLGYYEGVTKMLRHSDSTAVAIGKQPIGIRESSAELYAAGSNIYLSCYSLNLSFLGVFLSVSQY